MQGGLRDQGKLSDHPEIVRMLEHSNRIITSKLIFGFIYYFQHTR